MLLDLHIHTGYSGDCALDCADIITFYEGQACAVIAITDHDSVAAHSDSAFSDRTSASPRVVPAVELTLEERGHEFHFLSYNIPARPDAQHFLDDIELAKHRGTLGFITGINALLLERGLPPLDPATLAERHGRVHSYHFAQYITLVSELSFEQAYEELINPVRQSSSRGLPSISDALAKGFTSLVAAHPYGRSHSIASFALGDDNLFNEVLQQFSASGVVGLEALSRHHTPEQVTRLQGLAASHGYLCTGGSDLHHWRHFNEYLDLIRRSADLGFSYGEVVADSLTLLRI